MTTEELLAQARTVQDDLETLRANLEQSRYRPEVKSALSREITESQERIGVVIALASPATYALDAGAVFPAP